MTTNSSNSADKKYQVFISSNFREFAAERAKAVDVVIDRGHIPVALERFPAAPESVPDVIKRTIGQCQIYVVILGHRYGEFVPGMGGISYTELEYNHAVEQGLVVVPLGLDDETIAKQRAQLHKKKNPNERDKRERRNDERLRKFHQKVKRNRFYRPFLESDDKFRTIVDGSLKSAESDSRIKPGWIRAPENPRVLDVLGSLSKNPFVIDIVEKLSSFEKLDSRCTVAQPENKATLAKFFADTYQEALRREKVRLFFESGSTVAYLAKELAPEINIDIDPQSGQPDVLVGSNNVLAYLHLWLIHRVPCSPFPYGPPEDHYGASFGCLDSLFRRSPDPSYPPGPLRREEAAAIKLLLDDPFSPARWKNPVLMLGATSGLQLTDDYSNSPGFSDSERCHGPHVGSYKNKLFKRFMYATGHPLFIFLTTDKIDCKITKGECHFVLDECDSSSERGVKWQDFKRDHPLAFCVGCEQRELERYSGLFEANDFRLILGANYKEQTAFIARNAKFIETFERGIKFGS